MGLGYFRDFFRSSIDQSLHNLWYISSFGLLTIALFSIFILKKIKRKEVLFWVLLFLVSLIFSTGGKEPLGSFVLWVYHYNPLMVLFKSPQHLLVISTFSLTVILGLGFFYFIIEIRKRSVSFSILTVMIFFVLLMIRISPFLTGNLGLDYLSLGGGGCFVDTYNLSPGYKMVFEKVSKDPEDFRVLPLPAIHSPYYLKTEYQNEGQGGDPFSSYSDKAFITEIGGGIDFVYQIEKLFYKGESSEKVSRLLSLANVKYILLREDVSDLE